MYNAKCAVQMMHAMPHFTARALMHIYIFVQRDSYLPIKWIRTMGNRVIMLSAADSVPEMTGRANSILAFHVDRCHRPHSSFTNRNRDFNAIPNSGTLS